MGIKELRQKRADLVKDLRALVDKAAAEQRDLTEDEQKKYDEGMAEAKALAKQIDRQVELEEEERQLAASQGRAAGGQEGPGEGLHIEGVREHRPGAEERVWGSFGEQLMAVRAAAAPGGRVDERLTTRAASGLNESVPSDGGFLVQQDFAQDIVKRAYETGVLAAKVNPVGLSSNANGMKINAIDETSRASGSRWGGIQGFWENEADAFTGKRPKFRQMDLVLRKLTGLCYATDELLQDAGALEAVIRQGFAEEFGFLLDLAFFNGSGVGQPLGILQSPAKVTVAKESGQAANTVVVENIVKMWARCWGRSRMKAAWYINQDIEPQLYTMSLAVGTGGVPVYMPANNVSGSPYSTLFGRPVIPLEQCETLGTEGDITLADMSQYLAIDKGGVKSDVSIHVRFLYDEQVFRFIYRVDGQPTWHKALTPFKGSNTLSPYVTLATRS